MVALAQHPDEHRPERRILLAADEHRPERPILLAVDQELGERPRLRVPPELADPISAVEVGEHQDVEQLDAMKTGW